MCPGNIVVDWHHDRPIQERFQLRHPPRTPTCIEASEAKLGNGPQGDGGIDVDQVSGEAVPQGFAPWLSRAPQTLASTRRGRVTR
jgi:hypothetical protein